MAGFFLAQQLAAATGFGTDSRGHEIFIRIYLTFGLR
jgi:hypothetical protein